MQSQSQYQSSYYAVLGVHPGASAAEIRAAYHRLAMVSSNSIYISGASIRFAREKQSLTIIFPWK